MLSSSCHAVHSVFTTSGSILFSFVTMQIFVADFGGNNWLVYDEAKEESTTLSPAEFYSQAFLPPGATLIAEHAHLGSPRKDTSLAQVYEADQLLSFYARAKQKGCTVKLFPQASTPRARARWGASAQKTDEVDAKAIALMVKNSPHMPLMNPPSSFEPTEAREAGWAFKNETNGILNRARRFKYESENDAVVQFIDDYSNEIASRLSPSARVVFDWHRIKKDGKFYASTRRQSRLYTIVALFLHPEGYVRLRPDTGSIPGIRWLRNCVLHMSPFHFRGGIARSNLYWHGFKNYAIGEMGTRKAGANGKVLSHYDFTPEQDREFRQHRKFFNAGIIEAMQVVRDLVKEHYWQ